MPWAQPTEPALAMGTMHTTLLTSGYHPESFSFHLEFFDYISRNNSTLGGLLQYQLMPTNSGIGDWIFAVPPFCDEDNDADEKFLVNFCVDGLKPTESIAYARGARSLAMSFLLYCAHEVLKTNPSFVIMFPYYMEFVPSLALGAMLQKLAPGINIGFVGASCESSFGAALVDIYPYLRFAEPTDADHFLPDALKELHSVSGMFTPVPKEFVSPIFFSQEKYRARLEETTTSNRSLDFILPEIPASAPPCYDEYFSRLEKSCVSSQISRMLWIPYETSRGCWWAEKSICSFCALTGASPEYRLKKSTSTAMDQMVMLAIRHSHLQFHLMDWIQPKGADDKILFSAMRDSEIDFKLYLQARPSISFDALKILAKMNSEVQLGIESLLTSVLKRMKKGTTGLQCIRLLRWCAELGVRANWNLIYDFPGGDESEYDSLSRIAPSLFHLAPPTLHKFRLKKLSPIFGEYDSCEDTKPVPQSWYRLIYRNLTDQQVNSIADDFEIPIVNSCASRATMISIIDEWSESFRRNSRRLSYRIGPDFMIINDYRTRYGSNIYSFGKNERLIYIRCLDGAGLADISQFLDSQGCEFANDEILEFLNSLVAEGIMYEENSRYLSLAVHETGNAVPCLR